MAFGTKNNGDGKKVSKKTSNATVIDLLDVDADDDMDDDEIEIVENPTPIMSTSTTQSLSSTTPSSPSFVSPKNLKNTHNSKRKHHETLTPSSLPTSSNSTIRSTSSISKGDTRNSNDAVISGSSSSTPKIQSTSASQRSGSDRGIPTDQSQTTANITGNSESILPNKNCNQHTNLDGLQIQYEGSQTQSQRTPRGQTQVQRKEHAENTNDKANPVIPLPKITKTANAPLQQVIEIEQGVKEKRTKSSPAVPTRIAEDSSIAVAINSTTAKEAPSQSSIINSASSPKSSSISRNEKEKVKNSVSVRKDPESHLHSSIDTTATSAKTCSGNVETSQIRPTITRATSAGAVSERNDVPKSQSPVMEKALSVANTPIPANETPTKDRRDLNSTTRAMPKYPIRKRHQKPINAEISDKAAPLCYLSKSEKEFLASIGITTSTQLMQAKVVDIAKKYLEWRNVKGMKTLSGNKAQALVRGWKKRVRYRTANDLQAEKNPCNAPSGRDKTIIEIPDDIDSNPGVSTLRESRDRQFAIYVSNRINRDGDFSKQSNPLQPLESRESPTKEVLELLDDSDSNSEIECYIACETQSTTRKRSNSDASNNSARVDEATVQGASVIGAQNRGKKRKSSYSLSTQSSADEDSMSSEWTDSINGTDEYKKQKTAKKCHDNKTIISSASDTNSNTGLDSDASEPKNQLCDFTGKEVSTSKFYRRSCKHVQGTRATIVGNDYDESIGSTIRQSAEISLSTSSANPIREPKEVIRRKPPPPLKHPETMKLRVTKMYENMKTEDDAKKRSILEEALSQHKLYNHQHAPSRTILPRLQGQILERHTCKEKIQSEPTGSDCHTALVNSSLTVLPTVDDDTVEAKRKQQKLETKAENLSLMPYEYKLLQQEFTTILEALPNEEKYHPETHQYVSELLYTMTENPDLRLEVPPQFEGFPTGNHRLPEVTPESKNSDENNDEYEDVMKSFRDFCVQCKTFDCQFHITSYPDAGTQACVAMQYDKKALQRQSREQYRFNNDDPFSFIVPTTENKMTLLNKERYVDRCRNTTNSDGKKCPFCDFSCGGKDKLEKHLSRYHQDTFYCKEIGGMTVDNARTEAKETMQPVRDYFHSRSLIPIKSGHYDRDSDDESDYSWYHEYRTKMLGELIDVGGKERCIQIEWNRFFGYSPIVLADRDIPKKCFHFIENKFMKLKEHEWELYQLLITFWERHLLTVIHVEKLMHLYHELMHLYYSLQGAKYLRVETPLTPRKQIIFSRLHMIFESFGSDDMSRLREATRLNDLGNSDVVDTPLLPKYLWPKRPKKRSIQKMQRRAADVSKPFFYPCHHAGKCEDENNCTCIDNNCLCTKHCICGEFGENFFPGCACTGDCAITRMCPCRDANRECDPDVCRCRAATDGCRKSCGCANMDVTLAKRAPLLVGRSETKGAGLGLFTKNDLKKGDYIDEYIGELIKREHQLGRTEEYYFDHSDDYITDATHQGNKTRYLNHSLTPNIEARHRFVNGEKRIAFYAKHDIPAQSELFYSYGKSYNNIWRSKGLPHLCVDSDENGYINDK